MQKSKRENFLQVPSLELSLDECSVPPEPSVPFLECSFPMTDFIDIPRSLSGVNYVHGIFPRCATPGHPAVIVRDLSISLHTQASEGVQVWGILGTC